MNQKYDLTKGPILNRLLMVSLPLMGTQLMQMTYNLTDMFWLGRVSSDVVAASGTAGMYMWLANGFMFIGRTGAEIGVSQQLGKGNRDSARSYSQNALLLSIWLGVVCAIVCLAFNRQMISFFAFKEAHVATAAEGYLSITGAAIPFTFITGVVAGTFNAAGNSKTPFLINCIGLIINMILDPLLIFSANLEIVGAAIATSIAQVVVCLLSLAAINMKRFRPLDQYRYLVKPDKEKIKHIFRWSTPVMLESVLFSVLSMTVSRFTAAFGADAIAVQRVSAQVESLSWLIAGGFSTAVTAFVGQNYGAGKWTRIRDGIRISSLAMLVWGAMVMVLLFFGGGLLFSIFLPDAHLVSMGARYLRILSMCQIMGTLEGVGTGTFRGVGKTLPPSISSVSVNAFRVVLAYILSRTSLGLSGIWWAVSIGALLRGLFTYGWSMVMMRDQPYHDLPDPETAQA